MHSVKKSLHLSLLCFYVAMGYKMLQHAKCHNISRECIMNKVRFANTYQKFWKLTNYWQNLVQLCGHHCIWWCHGNFSWQGIHKYQYWHIILLTYFVQSGSRDSIRKRYNRYVMFRNCYCPDRWFDVFDLSFSIPIILKQMSAVWTLYLQRCVRPLHLLD